VSGVGADLAPLCRGGVQDLGRATQRYPRVERRTRATGGIVLGKSWVELARQRHVAQVAGQGGDEAVEFPDHPALRCIRQLIRDRHRGGDMPEGLS
jgi:hypothetical protein